MPTYTETLQLPFGSVVLSVISNGKLVSNHEFESLPIDQIYEDLFEDPAVDECFLGGLRVKLEPSEFLRFDYSIDVDEDWDALSSYGDGTNATATWNRMGMCLAVGGHDYSWFRQYDPAIRTTEVNEVEYIYATQTAIIPILISIAISRDTQVIHSTGFVTAGYDPQEPIDSCIRVTNYALREWLGRSEFT